VKERPILFSGPMVRAILEGRKTQTRRIMKPQPSDDFQPEVGFYHPSKIDRRSGEYFPGPKTFGASDIEQDFPCRHGQPGGRLWVRETWRTHERDDGLDGILYRADDAFRQIENTVDAADRWCAVPRSNLWRSSIFMPRWASRITLEITGVRVERLQEITEKDAIAEGVEKLPDYVLDPAPHRCCRHIEGYCQLWESINGDGSWAQNPWVWVIEFKRIGGAA